MDKPNIRMYSATHTGRIGEFFAMYVLERCGIECHHVDRSGVDLWCQTNNEDMFTLQVKSANLSKIKKKVGSKPLLRYVFNLQSEKVADFYMFIALDIQKALIMQTKELGQKKCLQLHPNKFTDEAEQAGLDSLHNFRRADLK